MKRNNSDPPRPAADLPDLHELHDISASARARLRKGLMAIVEEDRAAGRTTHKKVIALIDTLDGTHS